MTALPRTEHVRLGAVEPVVFVPMNERELVSDKQVVKVKQVRPPRTMTMPPTPSGSFQPVNSGPNSSVIGVDDSMVEATCNRTFKQLHAYANDMTRKEG
jgi:hypothetical protein